MPYGASDALGAMGYVRMAVELLDQCASAGFTPTCIVHGSGSAGTQAGDRRGRALCALEQPMQSHRHRCRRTAGAGCARCSTGWAGGGLPARSW